VTRVPRESRAPSARLEIVFPAGLWRALRLHLFGPAGAAGKDRDEQMALLLAAPGTSAGSTRLVVAEMLPAGREDLVFQSAGGIAPTGEFVARALTRCRQEGWSLIEVHCHPFTPGRFTTFSAIDWRNDLSKMPALARLLPRGAFHATMVVGPASLDAHYYDRMTPRPCIRPVRQVTIVGGGDREPGMARIRPTTAGRGDRPRWGERFSRQVVLLGHGTQDLLAESSVAVIGLGGLGSLAALQLAHLGAGRLILIDPDVVERSNLNRLIGATEADIGRSKAELYAAQAAAVSPGCEVTALCASILDPGAIDLAKQADVLLGCVDSHGARLVINQLAVQYLIPLIDGGVGARLDHLRNVTDAGGQVQVILPGLGCLACRGFIDARQAALDLAPAHVRQLERDHGYGTSEPAPAVVFMNGVVASLQVAEAVKLISGHGAAPAPILRYDLLRQTLMTATFSETGTCPTCGPDGVSGLADLSPLAAADELPVPAPPVSGGSAGPGGPG
jgi:molybdopterin-synthase adenylyltransferase